MRTRYKSNENVIGTVGPCHQKWYVNGNLSNEYDLPAFTGTLISSLDEETMSDVPEGGKRLVKPVIHNKYKVARRELSYDELQVSSADVFKTTGPNAHWRVWGSYGDVYPDNITVDWTGTEAALVRNAKSAFFNSNEVDNTLNVVESPELLHSTLPLYNRVNGCKVVKSISRKDIASFRRGGLGSLLSNGKPVLGLISGGYLYYSFGVAPLISDMRKISQSLKTFKVKMEREIAHAGAVSTVRRRQYGVLASQITPTTIHPLPGFGSDQLNGSHWHCPLYGESIPVRICTVRGVRTEKYYGTLMAKLDYLMNRFGASGPATFAWQRIRFSFIADWFVDLSDVLNGLDNSLTGNRKTIKDITISEKWEALAPVIHHRRAAAEHSNYDGAQVALFELSHYHRKPVPDTLNVGLSGRFGKKQAALSVALISQMAANLKRKKI